MIRNVVLALVWCAVMVFCIPADEPKKPQWQRMLTGDDAKKAEELQRRADELGAKNDFAGVIKVSEELLALRTRLQGEDHHQTVYLKHAIAANRKIAELSPDKRQGWQAAQSGALDARALGTKGRFVEAFSKWETYLKWSHEVLGEEHPHTALCYNNMAIYLNAQRKYGEAQLLFQKAFDIHLKRFGEEHPDTATSYYNMASNLGDHGKHAEVQPLYQKALDIRRKILGEEHPDTANSYNGAAINLDAQGKVAEALPLFQKALDIRRKVLGEEHADTAASYSNVAFGLRILGKYSEAQSHAQKALDIRRKVLGEEHADTAVSYSNVALGLNDLGKHVEAQLLFQKALGIFHKVLGEEHPHTAKSYNNMALSLDAQGKHAEGQLLYQKALDIRRKILGDEHTDTATSYNGLGVNLDMQGKYAEAQPLLEKALDIRRKVLGEEHHYTANSYNNLAFNLNVQEKYVEAQLLDQKALDIRRNVLGEEHRYTAESYSNLATDLNAQGKYTEAQPHYQKSLDIYRKVFGEDHPSTATSYNNVAFNLDSQRKYAEAQSLHQKSLDIQRKVFGEEHPSTAKCFNNLAVNLYAQRKYADARAVLERAIYSYESSRLVRALGLERALLANLNPRLLLAVLQHSQTPNDAWRSIELTLARGLLDQQAIRSDPALSADEQAAQTKQRDRIAAVQPQILYLVTKSNRTETETATLEKLLNERRDAETRLATLAVTVSQRQVADPDVIRKAIPADAALLFWVDVTAGNEAIQEHWACVVRTTGEPKWERLPSTGSNGKWSANDTALPAKLRRALANSATQAEVESLAKQLHTQRIAPVLKHLDGARTLYVVPVDQMAGVPVELLTPNHTVSYVPSGTFLARARSKASPASQRLLALGDPIFNRPDQKPTAPKPLPSGGLLITQVVPSSIAGKARLQAGDVLLKYGNVELKDTDSLKAAITANEKVASISVTVWRESADKPFVRDVAPGRLGVVVALDPAPVAIANRRKTDAMLLALNRGGWNDLPGTRVETDRLRQLLGDQCRVLTDDAASEQELDALRRSGELAKFRYLHFATHGEGNSVRAFESALILAQDKLPKDALPKVGEPFINGQLSAAEVLEFWKLDAELVTLSACETAVGKSSSGEGSLGFAQAFLHAGSRSVCLSLWKVDDTATTLLMDRFYQNLLGKREGLTKPMGKAEALDESKRWLRNLSNEEVLTLTARMAKGVVRATRSKDEALKLAVPSADPKTSSVKDSKPFAHAKYWAAFVLVGDPN